MRKWGFLYAALAAAVVGCGGGGGASSGSGGSGGTGGGTVNFGRVAATVTLPDSNSNSILYVDFITGAERAAGDKYLTFKGVQLTDDFGTVDRDSPASPLSVNLSQYGTQFARVIVPSLSASPNVRTFTNFTLTPYSFTEQPADSNFSYVPGDPGVYSGTTLSGLPHTLQANVTVFPGRQSILPVYIDNTMFTTVAATDTEPKYELFDSATYDAKNTLPSNGESNSATDGKIKSIFSDFVRFPLGDLTVAKPKLSDGATDASYLFISGDNYALSDGTNGGVFEELTPDLTSPVTGYWKQYSKDSTNDPALPNQYSLTQYISTLPDPATATKVSGYGIWRDYDTVLKSTNLFEVYVFPNSVEQYTGARPGDMIAILRTAPDSNGLNSRVLNIYFGDADLTAGTFRLTPIRYLTTGIAPDNEVLVGTLNNYIDKTGTTTTFEPAIRFGSYQFKGTVAAPTTLSVPSSFKTSGDFAVFRK